MLLRVDLDCQNKQIMSKQKLYGFTLMELMIVMVLLGILTMVGISSFQSSQLKGRDARRKADLSNISLALEAYFNDQGKYPADDGNGKIKACYPDNLTVCEWGSVFKDKNETIYMIMMPKDPASQLHYYYDAGTNGLSYQLYARLENLQDISLILGLDGKPQVYSGTICGTKVCNYGVASANLSLTDQNHSLIGESGSK